MTVAQECVHEMKCFDIQGMIQLSKSGAQLS